MENTPLQNTRSKDIIKRHHPDRIIKHERNGKTYFEFYCKNDIVLRLHVLSDTIIRFRYAFDGDFERDFSYAIDKRFKQKPVNTIFDEFEDKYLLSTDKLRCEIIKEGLLINIYDSFGNIICEDDSGFYLD